MAEKDTDAEKQWFVMRDLRRSNAAVPAYKALTGKKFEVFTPLVWKIIHSKRCQVPFISDLLFVHSTRARLDPIVGATQTLQYRFAKGEGYCKPMVVPTADMERFIRAVKSTDDPVYYTIEEITPDMCGKKIRIVGGTLNGYEGILLSISSTKRLLVDLPGFFSVGVKLENVDYVAFA